MPVAVNVGLGWAALVAINVGRDWVALAVLTVGRGLVVADRDEYAPRAEPPVFRRIGAVEAKRVRAVGA